CLLCCSGVHRDLHSFPTRRSSDLFANHTGRLETCADKAAPTHLNHNIILEMLWCNPGLIHQLVKLSYAHIVACRKTCISLIDFLDRKSTRLNSSHVKISYAVFCLK